MLEIIKNRRSVREFTDDYIRDNIINKIIEMGVWAPSGLNNQPWKFIIIRDKKIKDDLSLQTHYSQIIKGASVLISVFLDHDHSYDRVKDIQAIGACIQNMLLAIHSLGLGGVWLGQILKNRTAVEKLLLVPESCELMAVIALGKPAKTKGSGVRKEINQVVIGRL